MPEILTTHGIAARLERVIARAAREVILVTPTLQLSRTFVERLRDADRRGVSISLVCREALLRPAEEEALLTLPHLAAYRSDNLHATCYLSERELLLTSMPLLERSGQGCRELGVAFAAGEPAYDEAREEVRSIVAAATRTSAGASFARPARRAQLAGDGSADRGSCIRCGCEIARRDRAPFCYECYTVWARLGNRHSVERFCHGCGVAARTTIDAPRCDACAPPIARPSPDVARRARVADGDGARRGRATPPFGRALPTA